jgi:hypothetical protein
LACVPLDEYRAPTAKFSQIAARQQDRNVRMT